MSGSQDALEHLKADDPVMAFLIGATRAFQREPSTRTPFEALARAIAHQQLHGVAAGRILARLAGLHGDAFPTPEQLLQTGQERLRAVGFSHAKIAALEDLARKTVSAVVPSAALLASLEDQAIIERLTQVRGIGRWSVEMLLIFQLQRADVLPVDDFGVRSGFRLAYGLSRLPTARALAQYGQRWSPYRSTAAWYLWRAAELARQGPLPRLMRAPRLALMPKKAKPIAKPARERPRKPRQTPGKRPRQQPRRRAARG